MAQFSVEGSMARYGVSGSAAVHAVTGQMARYAVVGSASSYVVGTLGEFAFGDGNIIGIGRVVIQSFKSPSFDIVIEAVARTAAEGFKGARVNQPFIGVGQAFAGPNTGTHSGIGQLVGLGSPTARGGKNISSSEAIAQGIGAPVAAKSKRASNAVIIQAIGSLVGDGDAGAVSKAISYRTSTSSTSNATVFSFTGQDIGTASADRRVIIGASGSGGNNSLVNSVTIAGNGASELVDVQNTATGEGNCALYIRNETTGTSATIGITFSALKGQCAIGIWAATGLSSDTPVDTDSSTANPLTNTLTSLAGGFVVAIARTHNNTSFTWTNASERFDTAVEGTSTHTGADGATAGTSITVTATQAASAAPTMAVATF